MSTLRDLPVTTLIGMEITLETVEKRPGQRKALALSIKLKISAVKRSANKWRIEFQEYDQSAGPKVTSLFLDITPEVYQLVTPVFANHKTLSFVGKENEQTSSEITIPRHEHILLASA